MSTHRTRISNLSAAIILMSGLLAAPLIAAPGAADARPGGGYSMGSRGSRTYSMPAPTRTAPYSAAPMDRSAAPRPGGFGSNPGGFGSPGRSLATGLLGGFLGASLAGMLFGHSYGYGGGYGGGFGLLGLLIKLALLFFVLRWLYRRFFGASGRMAPAGSGIPAGGYGQPQARMAAATGWARSNAPNLAIAQSDYTQFERVLKNIQAAWTRADYATLQQLATPEMVAYFGQQLQDLTRRGARNAVSDVRLDQGDLSEAWSESGQDFATVAMRYSLIDVTTDASGRVIDGSPTERVTVTELWTFVRRSGGDNWVLSAIQQTR